MRDLYTCPQCGGKGCAWCNYKGNVTEDHLREIHDENRRMDDDTRSWRRDIERSGTHFGG